ncbi:MAG: hypothetical protein EOO15_02755 [Chitinophagaceae bacterium]|nr:MAG: hypothetical protein EOO15_02755 [Chitinophagaceae bacterium]
MKLTDLESREKTFAVSYVERGGRHGAGVEAALAAGLSPSGNRAAARVRANEMLRDPKVLGFIKDELIRKINTAATIGVDVLIELAADPTTPHATRLAAARDLIDRSGIGPVMSRNAHVHAASSIEDVLNIIDSEDRNFVDGEDAQAR